MPKKKTGARKKAEKQRDRQKNIRQAFGERNLGEKPCNASMLLEAKELLAQKNDLIENLKEELDKGTATAGNGGLDESLAVTEKNGDDPADKIMHFSIKFDGRRTIRKKKMSLMLRDLIFSTFTPDELGECTLSGRKGHKQLDPVRLECVKRKLLERFPSVPGDCLRRLVTNCLRDAKKKRNNNN